MAQPNNTVQPQLTTNIFSRIHDVSQEHLQLMVPIKGYENQYLMTLEEAVLPIKGFFNGNTLDSMVWIVKERCRNPADNLEQDESAAIMLYTLEWSDSGQSFYFILNKTLRMENRDNLKPWFPYLRLLVGGLTKLPPFDGIVHRGLNTNVSNSYPNGSLSTWWGFSSCTNELPILENDRFCGGIGGRTMFRIKCRSGLDIRRHSYFAGEGEILLLPGRYLRSNGYTRSADGLVTIELEEVEPPHVLLELPDKRPWRRFRPGLSLFGVCTSANCPAYNEEVIIPLGITTYDVLLQCDLSVCPQCKSYVECTKLGFCKCHWSLTGIKQKSSEAPVTFSQDWTHARGNTLQEFILAEFTWRQLEIKVRSENVN